MKVRWQQLFFHSLAWLIAEVVLTSIGMDDLADYGEYHFTSRYAEIAQLVLQVPTT